MVYEVDTASLHDQYNSRRHELDGLDFTEHEHDHLPGQRALQTSSEYPGTRSTECYAVWTAGTLSEVRTSEATLSVRTHSTWYLPRRQRHPV